MAESQADMVQRVDVLTKGMMTIPQQMSTLTNAMIVQAGNVNRLVETRAAIRVLSSPEISWLGEVLAQMRVLRGKFTEILCPACGFISLQRDVRTQIFRGGTNLYRCRRCNSVVARTVGNANVRKILRDSADYRRKNAVMTP